MIPPGFLQELLSRVDIVDVVGRHVELKRGGANLMGLCPFHGEKSPSFSVSPSKQFYYCFGCGASGDAIRFLTEHLGLSFVEAVRDLAQGAGLKVPEEQVSPQERERRDTLRQRRLSIGEALSKAAEFFRGQLKATPRAVDYLKKRGLTGAVAARFGLGFAPPGWRTLAGVFPAYDDPLLEEAGLVRQREAEGGKREGREAPEDLEVTTGSDGTGGMADAGRTDHTDRGEGTDGDDGGVGGAGGAGEVGKLGEDGGGRSGREGVPVVPDRGRYDWFRERVMFPIRGVGGEVIGFGGRVLDDAKPKYINSPETPVFSKGRELYGLFEARQALRDKGYALVVEGYMDVVALAQNGFANAVATLGTACTADHVQKLFRFTDAVVFSFDGDAAGRRAAGRALEAALQHASDLRTVRFLFLPPEHDPDSYVRELGAAAFEQQVAAAVPLSRQLIEQAGEGADLLTAEGRARMLAQAKPLWLALPDGALKRQLLPELARQAQLELADLSALWGRAVVAARAQGPLPAGRIGARSAGRKAPAALADLALRLLLRHSDWWARLPHDDHLLLYELGGPHGDVVAWLEQQSMEHGEQTWATLEPALAGQLWQAEARRWVDAAAADEEQHFSDLQRVMHRLWGDRLDQEARELIATGQTDRATLQRVQALRDRVKAHRDAARDSAVAPNAS
ncbi:MAG: DNA primase [Rubrivivax sp.]|nr:DNA primase [Rubrivivax sp.]